MKNAEFKEFYNFSLRVNFKRVQILKIFQNPSIFTFLNKTNLGPLCAFSLLTVVKKLKRCFMQLSPSQNLKLLFKQAFLQKQP